MAQLPYQSYFFCGIGGSGMSGLAQLLVARGAKVSGSDRAHDAGTAPDKFTTLTSLGIQLYPQDGSGLAGSMAEVLVVSTAVEDSVPDVIAAKSAGMPIITRAKLLAQVANTGRLIAVGGTSGKSTVTGMLGHILAQTDHDPTVINGAAVRGESHGLGNVRIGSSNLTVIEADESDGSIEHYTPQVSVVTNISLDHKPLDELRPLFADFIAKAATGAVLNLDCEETMALREHAKRTVTFSLGNMSADFTATNITPQPDGISFQLYKIDIKLAVPGRHNVANALAAMAAASVMGVPSGRSAAALTTFPGMVRRLETIGTDRGITVIDDFAHNPDKIAASLAALKEHDGRLIVIFQPHGFGPTKLLRDGLVAAFVEGLDDDDMVLMPEIFFAGGTAEKTISSADLVEGIKAGGKQAEFHEAREAIPAVLKPRLKAGDRVCIMGARDETLGAFAREILAKIS